MSKVVLANGCFDLFHYGHLLHLEAAAKMGDVLVVSVTHDAGVAAQKGRDHPVYPDWQRARIVKALECVADVLISEGSLDALQRVKPDIFVKGVDYIDSMAQEDVEYCRAHGIEIRHTDTPKMSATEMIDEARRRS